MRAESLGLLRYVPSGAYIGHSASDVSVSQDETRLLKRKEQNRAAQRAFRERKEKHVRDVSTVDRISDVTTVAHQSDSSRTRLLSSNRRIN